MSAGRLALGVLLALFVLAPPSARGQETLGTDDLWWGGFAPHGAIGPLDRIDRGEITGAVVHEGSLLVAGRFRYMDGVPVSGLARWTGEGWEPFDATGLPPELTAIVHYEGDLIVGGLRNERDTSSPSCLHRWTGTAWEPFGPDDPRAVQSQVERLKVAGGRLYAILLEFGDFAPDPSYRWSVVRWDGSDWEEVGFREAFLERGAGHHDFLDVDEFRGDPVLATTGPLENPDSRGCVYRWTGSDAEILGGGANGRVCSLCVYEGRLFAAGVFDSTGSRRTGPVASWNGTAWEAAGEDLELYGERPALSTLYATGDRLYAYGPVTSVAGYRTTPLLTWNGSGWDPSPWDYISTFDSWAPGFLLEYDGKVFYGGEISLHYYDHDGLATWDGSEWKPFPPRPIELTDPPTAFLPTDEGLVVAGRFALDDYLVSTRGIARWDGAKWTLLAEAVNGTINALAQYRGRLVAGGGFYRFEGVSANHIAQLVDGQWQQIGNGFEGTVDALEVYDGHLVAGGRDLRPAGDPRELIAAWDGLAWKPLGRGLSGGTYARVGALETYGGRLVAAGHFDAADGRPAGHIAAWDGRGWTPLGPAGAFTQDDDEGSISIERLQAWRGRLFATGRFDLVMGQAGHGAAVWNGETWSPFVGPWDDSLGGYTDFIASYRDRLLIGGRWLRNAEGDFYPGIVQYDGTQCHVMGSSVTYGRPPNHSGASITAAAAWRGRLFLGGDIRVAGNKPSSYIARWDGTVPTPPPVDPLRSAPNPAFDASTITFRLDGPGRTAVRVFDVQGRRVRTLHDGFLTGGDHVMSWDLRDGNGRRVPTGVYFLRVDSPFSRAAEKVVVTR